MPNPAYLMPSRGDADAHPRIAELLRALSLEFENLQKRHLAAVEQNSLLTNRFCSGNGKLADLDDSVTEACKNAVTDLNATDAEASPLSREPLQEKLQEKAAFSGKMTQVCSLESEIQGNGVVAEPPTGLDWEEPSPSTAHLQKQGTSMSSSAPVHASSAKFQQYKSETSRKLTVLAQRFSSPRNGQIDSEDEGEKDLDALESIHRNVWFEPFIAAIIMANAFTMAAELQYSGFQLGYELKFKGWALTAAESWPNAVQVFEVLEWVFGIVFALEMLFKMKVLRCKWFKDAWNWIDAVIVACWALEKLSGSLIPIGTQWIRIVRLMRLGRLLTLVRTAEGFDHLFLIVTALKGSLAILAWALLLLFVLHMTFALVLSQFLQATYFEDPSPSSATQHQIFEYFGTWTRAMLSMFEVTLANWPPICRLLSEEVSEWFTLLILLHKFTVGFAVVGVINGVFMRETFKVAATDDTIMVRQKVNTRKQHRANMEHLFEALDSNGDGRVTMSEFENLAVFPQVSTWLEAMELQTDDHKTLFNLLDIDGDGELSFEELLKGVDKLKGAATSIDLLAFIREQRAGLDKISRQVHALR